KVVAAATRGSLVTSQQPGHLVAVLGLEDMVVVHTADATLVCPKSRAEELKTLVEEIRRRGHEAYL
ncbi:MAG TPA: mannose-1-phosphate guanylyltransferase, partial [Planctomycetota bacterium]|nr:mannose-1-phosphate guanylyltransferase [Planctomycetota bacterium]